MKKIIFLEPIIEYKIWGGTNLSKFGYKIKKNNAGEAWLIACFKNKSNKILNLENQNLYEFYKNNKYFFNFYEGEYPLLTKIIDAKDDLSIQVHPDDSYAKENHNSFGKTECWYILDCNKDSSIIYGHNAKDKNELTNLISNKEWNKLLKETKIKKDDFYYIPSGTIHAIKKNTLIFELQQSSDITYRLYDYDRLENGKPRDLHINESIDVITFKDSSNSNQHDNFLVDNHFFKLIKIINNGVQEYQFKEANWLQCTVIKGIGLIDNYYINKGSTFIIEHNYKFTLKGELILLISYV